MLDVEATVDALVRASRLPMSVVIVGVGGTDFSKMTVLDADVAPLKSSCGVVAARDIVQFVKLSDYTGVAAGARLARDVLAEAPRQLVQFFMGTGRPPGPPQDKPSGMAC